MDSVEKILSEQLLKAVTMKEEEVDRQIEQYDALDENELEAIRQKRIQELKQKQLQKQEWLRNGHGSYEEIPDERTFFNATKKSNKVVCHFYLRTSERCKIVDNHLKKIAPRHVETRFVYANAEKFPFLTERLKIRVIPTIAIIIDAKTVDYIRGFDDLGGVDDFRTETLEWRLSVSGVISYDGPSYLPGSDGTKTTKAVKKKTIRGKGSDDEDEDW